MVLVSKQIDNAFLAIVRSVHATAGVRGSIPLMAMGILLLHTGVQCCDLTGTARAIASNSQIAAPASSDQVKFT